MTAKPGINLLARSIKRLLEPHDGMVPPGASGDLCLRTLWGSVREDYSSMAAPGSSLLTTWRAARPIAG